MMQTLKTVAKYTAAVAGGIVLDESIRFVVRTVRNRKNEQTGPAKQAVQK